MPHAYALHQQGASQLPLQYNLSSQALLPAQNNPAYNIYPGGGVNAPAAQKQEQQQRDKENNIFDKTSESFFIVDNKQTNILESQVIQLNLQTDSQQQQEEAQKQATQVPQRMPVQAESTSFQMKPNPITDTQSQENLKQSDMKAYYEEQVQHLFDQNKLQTSQCNSFVPKIQFDQQPETLTEKDYAFIGSLFDINLFQKLRLTLLFRGSRDGYTNTDFMRKCAKQTKTLVLVKSWEHDCVFGGYASAAWLNEGDYIKDERAFIFSVTRMKKFAPKNPDFAIYLNQDYILCFGNDIMIANNCNQEENCSSKFPEDYLCPFELQDEEKQCYLTGAPNFQVDDIEVYKVNIDQNMDV